MGRGNSECMVSCQDKRLNKVHFKLMCDRGMLGKTYTVFFGNPILDLVKPVHGRNVEFILGKIKISIDAGATLFRLYNHIDCGYYKARNIFPSGINQNIELAKLITDLTIAKRIISDYFSKENLQIRKYLLLPDKHGIWQESEVGEES